MLARHEIEFENFESSVCPEGRNLTIDGNCNYCKPLASFFPAQTRTPTREAKLPTLRVTRPLCHPRPNLQFEYSLSGCVAKLRTYPKTFRRSQGAGWMALIVTLRSQSEA